MVFNRSLGLVEWNILVRISNLDALKCLDFVHTFKKYGIDLKLLEKMSQSGGRKKWHKNRSKIHINEIECVEE
jgi:hypothetical protein